MNFAAACPMHIKPSLFMGRLVTVALLAGCSGSADSPDETTDGTSNQTTTQESGSSTSAGELPTSGGPDQTTEASTDTSGESDSSGPAGPDPTICPDGEVTDSIVLASQAAVDRMVGCTSVVDQLVITGDDIMDLGPLGSLVTIGGALEIRANPELASLAGLEHLESVFVLIVEENPVLVDLEGLVGLQLADQILINYNPGLTSLQGLRNVGSKPPGPQVVIQGNTQLTSVAGIVGIIERDTSRLYLADNPQLSDLSALAGVDALDSLAISGSTALTSLNGLEALERVESEFWLSDSPGLVDLAGLAGLRTVGMLSIDNNSSLIDLGGLSGLQSADILYLSRLPGLQSLAGLGGLVDVGQLEISNAEALTNLGGLSLSHLDALAIRWCGGLTSLAGLETVTITGSLELTGNASLASLDGLAPLDVLERLYIRGDDQLSSLSPFDSLVSVDDLTVINHAELPQADAEAWAEMRTVGNPPPKIDGNLGADPNLVDCPWVGDGECDDPTGTGLCPGGSDFDDCLID